MDLNNIIFGKAADFSPAGVDSTEKPSAFHSVVLRDLEDQMASEYVKRINAKLAKRQSKIVGPEETLMEPEWRISQELVVTKDFLIKLRETFEARAEGMESSEKRDRLAAFLDQITQQAEGIIEGKEFFLLEARELEKEFVSMFEYARQRNVLKQLIRSLMTPQTALNKNLQSKFAKGLPHLFFFSEVRMMDVEKASDIESPVDVQEMRKKATTGWVMFHYHQGGTLARHFSLIDGQVIQTSAKALSDRPLETLKNDRSVYSPEEDLAFGLDGEAPLLPAFHPPPHKTHPYAWASVLYENERFFEMIEGNEKLLRQAVHAMIDNQELWQSYKPGAPESEFETERNSLRVIASKKENFLGFVLDLMSKPHDRDDNDRGPVAMAINALMASAHMLFLSANKKKT